MKTAYAYARFSSDNQREESIEAQFYEIKKYAKEEGILIQKYFADEGISGRTTNRPQFLEMLEEVYKGKKIDYIIVHKVDRFSRDKYQSAIIKERLSRRGVKVLYAAQKLSDTPEGDLMESILEGFAQYYSKNLSAETRKGQYTNARKGLFNGGRPPLGYYIDDDQRYRVDEYEAVIVKFIFDSYLQGISQSDIARACNKRGYKTKFGKGFSQYSIKGILTNKKYAGIYEHGRREIRFNSKGNKNLEVMRPDNEVYVNYDAIPAIVDKEVFDQVQKKIKDRANQRAPRQHHDYPLRGIIYCECGKKMYGYTDTRYSSNSVYRCKWCANRIKKEKLENYIMTVVRRYILDNSDLLEQKIKKEVDKILSAKNTDRNTLRKRLNEIDKEENNCIEFITELGANDKIKNKLEELAKERTEITKLLEAAPSKKDLSKEIRLWIAKIKNNDLSLSKKDLIRLMVSKIVVSKEDVQIFFNFTARPSEVHAPASTLEWRDVAFVTTKTAIYNFGA